MTAYYNEIDPYAARWLRNLIKAGHIADGIVDERSIEDVRPDELFEYTQCHFFAGIGIWSLALRQAGWPDDRPVWTGSCPCQPFSAAGKGDGFDDERHLWPAWFHLISKCRPDNLFGEQVASKDGLGWFNLVQADLEGAHYAIGGADTCAAGFGSPHIRQRLYFCAYNTQFSASALGNANGNRRSEGGQGFTAKECNGVERNDALDWMANSQSKRCSEREQQCRDLREESEPRTGNSSRDSEAPASLLADANGNGCSEQRQAPRTSLQRQHAIRKRDEEGLSAKDGRQTVESTRLCDAYRPRPTNGFWSDADWLFCRDGKWRCVEPKSTPLAHGNTQRVGQLRAYGNAIVAPQAQGFIEAFMEVEKSEV